MKTNLLALKFVLHKFVGNTKRILWGSKISVLFDKRNLIMSVFVKEQPTLLSRVSLELYQRLLSYDYVVQSSVEHETFQSDNSFQVGVKRKTFLRLISDNSPVK